MTSSSSFKMPSGQKKVDVFCVNRLLFSYIIIIIIIVVVIVCMCSCVRECVCGVLRDLNGPCKLAQRLNLDFKFFIFH